jgi:hypothetical protein
MRSAWLGIVLWWATSSVGCQETFRVGDEVMVEWEGKHYPAVILTAEGPAKFRIHYDGYDEAWDEVVPKSRIQGLRKGDEPRPEPPAKVKQRSLEAAQTNTYRVGDQVRVEWSGRYYPAQIIDVVGKERYRVHYEGYGSEWDETVGLNRMQPR